MKTPAAIPTDRWVPAHGGVAKGYRYCMRQKNPFTLGWLLRHSGSGAGGISSNRSSVYEVMALAMALPVPS